MNLSKKSVKPRKKIYICHQAFEKSHFKALYDCAVANGYEIADFIILNQKNIKTEFVKSWQQGKYLSSILEYMKAQYKLIKLRTLREELLVVGIAPYDYLMNQYEKVFAKNKSIYFTSWQYWDGKYFPNGELKNRHKFEQILKNSFKGIACVSKHTELGVKQFGLPTVVVNHAVDVAAYEPKQEYVNNNRFIFLGRLEKVKNLEIILKYMKEHPDKEIQIDFVGNGEYKNRILKASGSDNRIHYLGKWSKEEIQSRLKDYAYLLLPSHKEPFGIVLLEALACGVPCITSNAYGPIEIIHNGYNGFNFELKNESDFEKVMDAAIYTSHDEYKRLSQNALKDSERYSSENIMEKWSPLFEYVSCK